MLLYRRPDVPSRFTNGRTANTLQAERDRIRNEVNAGGKPKISNDLWGRFKAEFAAAQLDRCGYCECNVIANHRGDVEHFAPKNDVRRFTGKPGEEGVQIPHSASLKGRTPETFSDLGYWWLAYDWTNYLLSCVTCNQDWKGNLFPVLEPPPRVKPPTEQGIASERILLLNPFGPLDPAKHLKFNEDGSVEPLRGSRYGLETIRTVGLYRTALVQERSDATQRAFESVREATRLFDQGKATGDNTGLKDLHRMGQAGRPFAGVVRAIIRQQLKVTWEDLHTVFAEE
jgi:hypothetical protein